MGVGSEESGGRALNFSPSAPLHGCSGPGRQETQPGVPLACPSLEASPTTARPPHQRRPARVLSSVSSFCGGIHLSREAEQSQGVKDCDDLAFQNKNLSLFI